MDFTSEKLKIRNGNWKSVFLSLLFVFAATVVGFWLSYLSLQDIDIMIVYLICVLLTARLTQGYCYGLAVSVFSTFAYNYFFIEPTYQFRVSNSEYLLTFFLMIVASIMTSASTSQMKQAIAKREEKEAESRVLYYLSNALSDGGTKEQIVDVMLRTIRHAFPFQAVWIEEGGANKDHILDRENYQYWDIIGKNGRLGCIRFPRKIIGALTKDKEDLLRAIIENVTMSLDRIEQVEGRRRLDEKVNQERYRANLLRSISHDIRTPLSGIMGTLEVMLDMTEKEDPKYVMEQQIYEDAQWLYAMVENILNLTRLQEGKLILNREGQVLEELIESAIRRIGTMVSGYDISTNMPEEMILVSVDARLIQQVLINLLDNAVKHTRPGDEVSVQVELFKEKKEVKITVLDKGSGIPEEGLENIFELFYSLDNSRINIRKGMGLGLPICQTIIAAHGGWMEAENRRDGPGAAVSFTLPIEDE